MKNQIKFIIVLFVISSFGCRTFAQTAKPSTEAERFKLAAEYSSQNRGVSVLVMKGDKVVFEDYQNGHEATAPWMLASGTKSFSGVMCAAAIEDRLIRVLMKKWLTPSPNGRVIRENRRSQFASYYLCRVASPPGR